MPVQVPNVFNVVEVVKKTKHAHVAGLLFLSPQDSEMEQRELSEVWTSVYSHSGVYHSVFCSERWDETPHSSTLCCLFWNRLLN